MHTALYESKHQMPSLENWFVQWVEGCLVCMKAYTNAWRQSNTSVFVLIVPCVPFNTGIFGMVGMYHLHRHFLLHLRYDITLSPVRDVATNVRDVTTNVNDVTTDDTTNGHDVAANNSNSRTHVSGGGEEQEEKTSADLTVPTSITQLEVRDEKYVSKTHLELGLTQW